MKKFNKRILVISFLVISLLLLIIIDKNNNIPFEAYTQQNFQEIKSKDFYWKLLDKFKGENASIMGVGHFGESAGYQLIPINGSETVVLLNSGSTFKKVKYVKRKNGKTKIKLIEREYKDMLQKWKDKISNADQMKDGGPIIVVIKEPIENIEVYSNFKKDFKQIHIEKEELEFRKSQYLKYK